VAPTSGTATVDGFDIQREAYTVRRQVGVLSDARGLYPRLTARENIRYYGQLHGLADAPLARRIDALIGALGLDSLADRRAQGFSQGERMKVAIARALVHDPPNVMLDEPTNGLDVMTTRKLRDVIRGLRDAGKCVLFSSHVMQEVSALCDEIVRDCSRATRASMMYPKSRAMASPLRRSHVSVRILRMSLYEAGGAAISCRAACAAPMKTTTFRCGLCCAIHNLGGVRDRRHVRGVRHHLHLPPVVGKLPAAIQAHNIGAGNSSSFGTLLPWPCGDRESIASVRATEQNIQ
jgi:ABC-type lipoprotein export system ATPase subunit